MNHDVPAHLAPLRVSLWNDDHFIRIKLNGLPSKPAGTVEQWWPLLTTQQQAELVMASIMECPDFCRVSDGVRLLGGTEIQVDITGAQRQEYYELHPKVYRRKTMI